MDNSFEDFTIPQSTQMSAKQSAQQKVSCVVSRLQGAPTSGIFHSELRCHCLIGRSHLTCDLPNDGFVAGGRSFGQSDTFLMLPHASDIYFVLCNVFLKSSFYFESMTGVNWRWNANSKYVSQYHNQVNRPSAWSPNFNTT